MVPQKIEHTPNSEIITKAQEKIIPPELVDDYVKSGIENILFRIKGENFPYSHIDQIAKISTQKIIIDIQQAWITNITAIKQVGYFMTIAYQKTDGSTASISFDLTPRAEKNQEYIGTLSYEALKKKEAVKRKAVREENEKLGTILAAMEEIFKENRKEFWEELEDDDIVKTNKFDIPWFPLKGKSIKELQQIAGKKIAEIKILRLSIFDEKIPSDSLIQENFETYLGYIVGIGLGSFTKKADYYEAGASHFEKTKEEMNFLIDEMAHNGSLHDVFQKMWDLHKSIDSNNYQTTTVEKNYKYFTDTLNQSVLNRMKQQWASKEDYLIYAQLVSGRAFEVAGKKYPENMDSRLYSPDMANKALMQAMIEPNGMMEQITNNLEISDPIVWNKKPKALFIEASKLLTQWLNSKSEVIEYDGEKILLSLNFWKLKTAETPYEKLSYQEKVQTSILARLIQKIKRKKYEKNVRGQTVWKWKWNTKHIDWISHLHYLFQEISNDAISDITNELSGEMDWSIGDWDGLNAQEAGFKKGSVEAEVYDLFRDINGSGGVFEFSDNTIEWMKDAAMMAAVVIGAMIVWGIIIATLPVSWAMIWGASGALLTASAKSVLVQGGIYGVSASISSWWLDYAVWDAKWYANATEAVTNIGTDVLVWGATGVFGGYLVSRLWVEGAKAFSAESLRNKGIFAWDIAVLGIGAEMGRIYIMDEIFHSEEIFQEK